MTTVSRTPTASDARTVETSIRLPGDPQRIWNALTNAQELMRWFPPLARVKPGAHGSIFMSWDGQYEGESRIELWQPPTHLRTTWGSNESSPGDNPERGLMVDYFLESAGGSETVLRLIHSGFGRGATWDNVYDSISNGWQFELRSLRHYLTYHLGKERLHAWSKADLRGDRQEAWDRLMGPEGLNAPANFSKLKEGDRYRLDAATGDHLEGVVIHNNPGRQFAGTAEAFNNGIVRFAIEPDCGGTSHDYVAAWIFSWDDAPSKLMGFKKRWTERLMLLAGA